MMRRFEGREERGEKRMLEMQFWDALERSWIV